jgi:hypothetical protein
MKKEINDTKHKKGTFMIKKGLVTLVCLTVMSALWAWAATTYSIKTTLTNAGGQIQVRSTDPVTWPAGSTAASIIKYTNYTTQLAVHAVVTPDSDHMIVALTQNGSPVSFGAGTAPVGVDFVKNGPVTTETQTLVATFATRSATVGVTSQKWQLQTKNTNFGGTIVTTRGTDTPVALVKSGVLQMKNYMDTTPVSAAITVNTGYAIKSIATTGTVVDNNGSVAHVTVTPVAGKPINTVLVTYMPLIPVMTSTPAGGLITPSAAKIAYGKDLKLTVSPASNANNAFGNMTANSLKNIVSVIAITPKANYLSATATDASGTTASADAAGNITATFRGPVKVYVTKITGDIAVTGTYAKNTVANDAKNACTSCHNVAGSASAAVYGNWAQSAHKAVTCNVCHVGGMNGTVNTRTVTKTFFTYTTNVAGAKGTNYCMSCHLAGTVAANGVPAALALPSTHAAKTGCQACHVSVAGGDAHTIVAASPDVATPDSCSTSGCHASPSLTTSVHGSTIGSVATITCQGCHSSAIHGVLPAAGACMVCHATGTGGAAAVDAKHASFPGYAATDRGYCQACHSTHGVKQVKLAQYSSVNKTQALSTGATITINVNCASCHAAFPGATGSTVTTAYALGVHNAKTVTCQACHTAFPHGTVGNPNSGTGTNGAIIPVCTQCHNAAIAAAFTAGVDSSTPAMTCASCHGANATSVHSIGAGTTVSGSCIVCHDVNIKHPGAYVADNSGVRAITTEFGKWSHHVTGVTLNDAHCAACHLEGKVVAGAIVVDPANHMADATVHLRNADTDQPFKWDAAAATPDMTGMDNYCMSCHDADGATSAGSIAIQGVINVIPVGAGRAATASALNPFGDTISNKYDQLSRGAVVAVKEQFDGGNTSHHGVATKKYLTKNLTAAQFTNISTANYANGDLGVSKNTQPGLLTVGTMYETSKMTAYVPFGAAGAIADNTQIHCADCHTVGQYKANTTNKINDDGSLGAAVATVIGAHGSDNEYMLRNQDGSDNTTNAKTAMVCYICHISNQYDGYTVNANSHNGAVNHSTSASTTKYTAAGDVNCNGQTNNTMGQVGLSARTMIAAADLALMQKGTWGTTGKSNAYANKCINCHNSGVDSNFGGIHGNAVRVGTTAVVNKNVAYSTYSAAGGATAAAPIQHQLVTGRQPYRFLPGLGNFRYNGGATADAWTRKSIGSTGKSDRMGCYTLNGTSASRVAGQVGNSPSTDYKYSPSPTKGKIAGTNVSPNAVADDNGILGSWGGCAHHSGSSTGNSGTSVSRTSLRPLTY